MPGRKPEGAHTVATAAAVSYRTGRGKSKRLERRAAKIKTVELTQVERTENSLLQIP